MPYRVRKQKSSKGAYVIEKNAGGKWTVVGHSATKAKAEASVRARENAEYSTLLQAGRTAQP